MSQIAIWNPIREPRLELFVLGCRLVLTCYEFPDIEGAVSDGPRRSTAPAWYADAPCTALRNTARHIGLDLLKPVSGSPFMLGSWVRKRSVLCHKTQLS